MSTDSKPTVQQAAKNGNPQAIAILLNRQLRPKGIEAKVSVKDSCLQIMLEAANVPNQKSLVAAIQKWIDGLGITSIHSVQIYAKQTGEEIPAWNDRFEIAKPLEEPKTANVASVALQTPQTKPIGKETANQVDSALVELSKNGDIKAISELIKNSLQQTDIKVRATLSKGLLQVVIVSNKVPKQDDSVESIPKLVTSFKSTLIQKVKVVGMQEIEGSNNSNVLWTQEFLIDEHSNNTDIDAIAKLCSLEFTQEKLQIVDIDKVDITARLSEENSLRIDICFHEELDQYTVICSIYKGIANINLGSFKCIVISLYKFGSKVPIWLREFLSLQTLQKFCDSSKANYTQQDFLVIQPQQVKNKPQKKDFQKTNFFYKMYFSIHPMLKVFIFSMFVFYTGYLKFYYIDYDFPRALVVVERNLKVAKISLHAYPSNEQIIKQDSRISEALKLIKDTEADYISTVKTFDLFVILLISMVVVSLYMEISFRINRKNLQSEYKKKYELIKKDLRQDPNNNALRQTALETARLSGYDEQTITNDLSAIQSK